jgi:O-antigen/teichoic acid export membrane protein
MSLPAADLSGGATPPPASRSIKVFALSMGNALAMVGGLVFAMVASRVLSKTDYASYRQTFLVYEFVAPLLQLGIPAALYYLIPRAADDTRGTLVDALSLLAIAALVFGVVLLLGGDTLVADWFDNPALRRTLPWLAVYPLVMLPVAAISTFLVYGERIRSLALFNMVVGLGTAGLTIAAVLWRPGFEWPAATRIVAAIAALPVALALTRGLLRGVRRGPSLARMGQMLRVSLPMGLAFMLGTLTLQLHSFIVAAMTTPEEFAVYANGAIEVPIVGIVVGSITTILFAEMSNACAAGELGEALALFRRAAVDAACILYPTMIYMALAAGPFIEFLYSKAYADSVVPFTIYLLTLPSRIVVYGAALMALGLSRVVLVRSVFDLAINAAACFLLVRGLGYNGAALGLVVTVYLWTVPYNLHKIAQGYGTTVLRLLPWRPLGKVFAASLAAAPLAWLALALTQGQPAIVRLLASSAAFGPVYLIALVLVAKVMLPEPVARFVPYLFRPSRKLPNG